MTAAPSVCRCPPTGIHTFPGNGTMGRMGSKRRYVRSVNHSDLPRLVVLSLKLGEPLVHPLLNIVLYFKFSHSSNVGNSLMCIQFGKQ